MISGDMYLHRGIHCRTSTTPLITQSNNEPSVPIKYRIHKFIQSIFDLLNPPSKGYDEGERYVTLSGRTIPLHTEHH